MNSWFWLQLNTQFKYNNMLFIFILFTLFKKINLKKELLILSKKYLSFGNEIIIKINGKGEHTFFFQDKINAIKEIYVNDVIKDFRKESNKILLEEDKNEIKIILDLNQIDSLDKLFSDCWDITEIDLSNFNSSSVTQMNQMFRNCFSLTSINFDNFITSKITSMQQVFFDCKNIKTLNLSTFNTSLVQSMHEMFRGCSSLIMLDLTNFNLSLVNNMYNIFEGCENLTILNLTNLSVSMKTNMDNNINLNSKKLKYINFKNACSSDLSKCDNLFKNIPNNIIICKDELNGNILSLNDKCITNYCGDDFNTIIKNISDGRGRCYLSCEDGLIEKNGKCQRATTNEEVYVDYNDNTLNHNEETNLPDIHMTYLEDSKSNLNIISTIILKNNYDSSIITNKSLETFNNRPNSFDIANEEINLAKIILSGDITSLLSNINEENYYREEDNKKYLVSTLSNQFWQNASFIDLGDCEDTLKSENNIDNTEELIIFKIENIFEGINIPIIEYEIYSRNGTKLNLDVCKDNNITYFIPVSINESELFKYDPESNFYNNRCEKFTTENDTDMTIYDRKSEYNNKNLSLCEFNCTYKGYNSNNSKVECNCKINTGLDRLDMNQIDLLNKLQNSKNLINADVVQCSEVLSSAENIKSNPGFFLLIVILVIFIIIFFIFWIKGYNSLKNQIEDVIFKRFKDKKTNVNKNKVNKSNNIINSNKNNLDRKKIKNPNPNKNNKKRLKDQNSSSKELKSNKSYNTKINKEMNSFFTDNNNNFNNIKDDMKKKLHETDYELNNALYEDAKRFDKRTGCDYYCSLLKAKQMFIFTFLTFDDYNSGVIKKFIFFLLFALHYTINALCFTDSNMHQIFEDQGNYNIKYQFKFIFISAVISTVLLRIILVTLVLTEKIILEIKSQPSIIHANSLKQKILKYMIIKFGIFFALNLIILVAFWYYLTCWNAIYENTQIYLIKNTFISFAISLIYPFVINIIPAILRIQSLKKSNREYLYNASKVAQLF